MFRRSIKESERSKTELFYFGKSELKLKWLDFVVFFWFAFLIVTHNLTDKSLYKIALAYRAIFMYERAFVYQAIYIAAHGVHIISSKLTHLIKI